MKKFGILITAVLFLAVPVRAFAGLCPNGGNFGSLCNIRVAQSGGVVGAIIQLLLVIAVVLCLFYLVYGGIRYITSGGDKAKVEQARSALVAAIVGLIISLLAFFIVGFVLYFFTGQGLSSLNIPKLTQ